MFPHLAASLANNHQSLQSQEEFESLFDSVAEEQVPSPEEEVRPALSDDDLAVFDPCYKQGEGKCEKAKTIGKLRHTHLHLLHPSDRSNSGKDHKELFSLLSTNVDGGAADYLNQAAAELKAAMEKEKEGEFSTAIRGYRAAVDILITGVQGK